MKNGGKNKSVLFIILFSVCMYVCMYVYIYMYIYTQVHLKKKWNIVIFLVTYFKK